MYENLPDIVQDEGISSLFLTGFSVLLLLLIAALAGIARARARARRAGIYRKYVAKKDQPNHRRMIDLP